MTIFVNIIFIVTIIIVVVKNYRCCKYSVIIIFDIKIYISIITTL